MSSVQHHVDDHSSWNTGASMFLNVNGRHLVAVVQAVTGPLKPLQTQSGADLNVGCTAL